MGCLTDIEVALLVQADTPDEDRGALLDHAASCDRCHALVSDSMGESADQPLHFGRYEMMRAVAGGGMGTVFCAYDPVLRRLVAIKIIADAARDDQEQMLAEARALASLRHENVVAIHDVGVVDGEMFLAMEFVEGTSLELARDPDRLAVLRDITDGLGAIHAAGLVHRDIKPNNIMVTPAGRAVLVDLGLAVAHGAEMRAAGSPGFVAPEVLAGQPATPASDQYAWWRVVDELFAEAPVTAKQREALRVASERGRDPDPAKRFRSIEAAYAAVHEIVAPRRRTFAWVAALATVVIASAVAFVLHGSPAVDDCVRLAGWNRPAVIVALAHRGFDSAKITAAIDARAGKVEQLLVGACRIKTLESDRNRLCLHTVWHETTQQLGTIAHDRSARRVALAIDGLARDLPVTRCTEGAPLAQAPPATREQGAAWPELYDRIEAAAEHEGKKSLAALDALRPAVDANGWSEARFVWASAIISELAFVGDFAREKTELDAARHLAQTVGDDVQLGWLDVTRLRLATDTRTDSDELEADVMAVVDRVGSPFLTAEALQARAERAYRNQSSARAVELLDRAIRIYNEVSLIPPPSLRTAYLDRAAALQQLGKLEEAQKDLDLAYAAAIARFAPNSAEVEDAIGARANNLIYLGRTADATAQFLALKASLTANHRARTASGFRVDVSICQLEMVQRLPSTEATCNEALAVGAAVYGGRSIQLISLRNALAQYLVEREPARAIPLLEDTLQIGANGGASPMDIPYAQALLALAYGQVKRHADGCKLARTALVVLRSSAQTGMVQTLEHEFPDCH